MELLRTDERLVNLINQRADLEKAMVRNSGRYSPHDKDLNARLSARWNWIQKEILNYAPIPEM